MSKLKNISGFPEWLPEQKIAEDRVINAIRRVYALHGFSPIETGAAELLSTLEAKGAVDKEIYLLKRVHADQDSEDPLALHFDLTVPMARYVAQNFNELVFPFRRYQLQKVWRGERPQKGRFREFYQFDIDIIARDELPLCCDAEAVTVIDRALTEINTPAYRLRINNRKVLLGFYRSLGIDEAVRKKVLIAVDKLHKIKEEGVSAELSGLGLGADLIQQILKLTRVQVAADKIETAFDGLAVSDEMFAQGRNELLELAALLPEATKRNVLIDLSLARGLDYYTGLILEGQIIDHPEFGSVCAGGRYDDLASEFINKKLPGVGISIGLTRLVDFFFTHKILQADARSTSEALVTVYAEEQRRAANDLADQLRAAGVASEVFYKSPKLGKQIDYAESKGMRYVFFVGGDGGVEVKDLKTKTQVRVDNITQWCQNRIA